VSACRACLAPLRWERTERGRPMPLDIDPNPAGNVVIEDGHAVVLAPGSDHPGERWMPHFSTCPNWSDR
jgi:hypothetical protein